jgi:hypothetical protein
MNDRIRRRTRSILATLALATLAAVPGFAAEELSFRRAAGDFWVYLSVMPAELTQGPRVFEPGATPFQTPAAQNTHYVMVSLFNYRTARRITDAAVEARVASLGFSGTKKALEPTTVAGAPVYAGLFPMQGRGPFRVDVEFRLPDAQRREHATFYFTHPSFAAPEARQAAGR